MSATSYTTGSGHTIRIGDVYRDVKRPDNPRELRVTGFGQQWTRSGRTHQPVHLERLDANRPTTIDADTLAKATMFSKIRGADQ
ncbi:MULTISPECIES: hypothetical protein [unclassified Nocardia]|uniref:hypothetical protein n=1 Tax=unclassified Nocardia TaxID=2637762 RepID=UPI00278C5807|nr:MULTISPECIES: hypothetical protein [unclassified Nocardia]